MLFAVFSILHWLGATLDLKAFHCSNSRTCDAFEFQAEWLGFYEDKRNVWQLACCSRPQTKSRHRLVKDVPERSCNLFLTDFVEALHGGCKPPPWIVVSLASTVLVHLKNELLPNLEAMILHVFSFSNEVGKQITWDIILAFPQGWSSQCDGHVWSQGTK
jgi:hypothetical protein